MRRTVLLAGGLPFISAFFGSVLAIGIMAASIVQAEQSRIRAEWLIIVGDGGDDRVRLQTGPAMRASISVLRIVARP